MQNNSISPAALKRKRAADTLLLVLAPAMVTASVAVGLIAGEAGLLALYGWNTLLLGVVILFPALLCMWRNGGLKAHGFVPIRMREWVLALVFGVGMFFFVTAINNVFAILSEMAGLPLPNTPMPKEGGLALIAVMLFMAVTPAIAEEAMFRGAFLHAWLPFGRRGAVLHAGILFALLHFQLTALPALLIVGCLLTWLTWATGSVYTSMAVHFSYNASAVGLSAIVTSAMPDAQAQMQDEIGILGDALTTGGTEGMFEAALLIGLIIGVLLYVGLGVLIAYPACRGLLRASAKRRGVDMRGRSFQEIRATLSALPSGIGEEAPPAMEAAMKKDINPYDVPSASPYDVPATNPYDVPSANPYDVQPSNPYDVPPANPYDVPSVNPYDEQKADPYAGQSPDSTPAEEIPTKRVRLISWKMIVAYILFIVIGLGMLALENMQV